MGRGCEPLGGRVATLDGTTAFVTGASQGIGRIIAHALGEAGANVALAAGGDGIHGTAEQFDALREWSADESGLPGDVFSLLLIAVLFALPFAVDANWEQIEATYERLGGTLD